MKKDYETPKVIKRGGLARLAGQKVEPTFSGVKVPDIFDDV
ncbi:hypothetical protein [Hoeflea poritis]|uniref:RiPP n=1 Tax=Hoeflea poritis TaxID=2993659 RepID=A0ABT4VH31_9HYPH|nr:hypothetical protein [Hoeflea poritis]MDA4843996.1 hypothetical protein [Hoeflea poritis]